MTALDALQARMGDPSGRPAVALAATRPAGRTGALVAMLVCTVTWPSRTVSSNCASAAGAVTSTSGSPANTAVPSGTAHTSPVNRNSRKAARSWSRNPGHPLALLLWAAGVLAFAAGTPPLGWAILAVIAVNALFAFAQERQAVRAVEALRAYLPERARVVRDGRERAVLARELVPGDVLLVEEGERVSADVRLLDGAVDVDMSALTGESLPVSRYSSARDTHVPLLHARELAFTGST